MSRTEFLIFLLIIAVANALTRFLPFVLFGKKGKNPPILDYLGKVLPAAMMGLLVVYCFKDIDFFSVSEILPAIIASAGVVILHLWKRNTVLSIALGTAAYMVLIRVL